MVWVIVVIGAEESHNEIRYDYLLVQDYYVDTLGKMRRYSLLWIKSLIKNHIYNVFNYLSHQLNEISITKIN